jgi:drug/metabolite transporter (DMT)-like permease
VKNKNNLAYLLLFLTTLFWSGNFIVGKAASFYEIPPFSLNFYRWLFAWLILFPFTFKELIKLAKQKAIYKNLMKKAELRTYLQPYQQ